MSRVGGARGCGWVRWVVVRSGGMCLGVGFAIAIDSRQDWQVEERIAASMG